MGERGGKESVWMLALVVADGEPDPADRDLLEGADLVLAADGGARWAEANGRLPDLVVGDLDSLGDDAADHLEAEGVRIVRHPTEKDASDTELAIAEAFGAGADRVVVVGALRGERLDHELANLLLLADPRYAYRQLRIVKGGTTIRAVPGGSTLRVEARAGRPVTLLPLGGDAIGVTTRGLRYPLKAETLPLGSSRGLSNVVEKQPASVRLEVGALLVVEPGNDGEVSHAVE
jgi:thiamine pyrophosphokinase